MKPSTRPSGPTVISLFLANLRLLNLDRLPDWPAVTATSFGHQDARARIRSTEFALFHLFRLYDPATTAEKLQPFFPSLEPLQSINLRAALYRCLNELKRSGVLGKEVMLRKTMLDECQGDKLWELCFAFSAIVVRKIIREQKGRRGRPAAETLGMAPSVSQGQRESMLPLAIAHKAALSQVLDSKLKKKETYARLYDVLVGKEEDLIRRRALAEEKRRSRPSQTQSIKLMNLHQHINEHWIGRSDLRSALVEGEETSEGDLIIHEPLNVLIENGNKASRSTGDVGVIEKLRRSTEEQAQRLRRFQTVYERLLAPKPNPAASKVEDAILKSQLKFDKHQNLGVRGDRQPADTPLRQRSGTSASTSLYDEILTSMREELRKTRRAAAIPPVTHSTRAVGQPQPPRKPTVGLDTAAGASEPHTRAPSQTVSPMGPGLGRRVSSRSKSYHHAKVESQRQPIPLKSELFSPLKGTRKSSTSPISASLVPSPLEESPASATSVDPMTPDDTGRLGGDCDRNGKTDSGVGLDIETPSQKQSEQNSRDKPPLASDGCNDTFAKPTLPATMLGSTKSTTRPSLAERTRMSMAFTSTEDQTGLALGLAGAGTANAQPANHEVDETPYLYNDLDSATLLDRTRHSISLAPPSLTQPKKGSGHARSRTSIFPVNQFDTPQKARRSSVALARARRDITPREQLFSPEAEYNSVFKSRPKIALSPVLSPHLDSKRVSMEGDGGLNFNVVDKGSPLAGLGGRQ